MKKSMKSLCVLLAVLLFVLSGCSSSSSGSNENVTLRYMIWDESQAPSYQKVIDAFRKENPSIKVQMEVVPFNNYWSKLKTQAAGGSAPDVFWNYVSPIPEFVEKKMVLDVSDKIKKDKIDLKDYNQTLVGNAQYNGKTYGLPKDWDAIGIYVNQDLLKEAGYDEIPKDLKWNPEDGGSFVKLLQSLTKDKNGLHPNEEGFDPKNIKQYGFALPGFYPQDLISFIASNGGEFIDSKGKVALNSEKSKEALQFVHDLIYKYHVSPDYTQVETTSAETMFYSENVSLWMTGSWMIKPMSENTSFKWGITDLPDGPEGRVTRINGLMDNIYSKSKYSEEAWSLVKFIASQKGQDILAENGTVFPANEKSISKFLDYYKQSGIDASIFAEEFQGKTVGDPQTTAYNEIEQIWRKNISLAYSNELKLEKALENISSQGNEKIK